MAESQIFVEEEEEETLLSAVVKKKPVEKCCFCAMEDDPSPPEGCDFCNVTGLDDEDSENIIDGYPVGTLREQRPDIDQLCERYSHQIRQSYGFEFYDFPGGIVDIVPLLNLKEDRDFELMMKLANRAIQEYNEKEHNGLKYKVLKIEKANCMMSGYEQFFLTVKVLNLTLGTPIETFYIRVAKRIPDGFEEVISCNPKGEGSNTPNNNQMHLFSARNLHSRLITNFTLFCFSELIFQEPDFSIFGKKK